MSADSALHSRKKSLLNDFTIKTGVAAVSTSSFAKRSRNEFSTCSWIPPTWKSVESVFSDMRFTLTGYQVRHNSFIRISLNSKQ